MIKLSHAFLASVFVVFSLSCQSLVAEDDRKLTVDTKLLPQESLAGDLAFCQYTVQNDSNTPIAIPLSVFFLHRFHRPGIWQVKASKNVERLTKPMFKENDSVFPDIIFPHPEEKLPSGKSVTFIRAFFLPMLPDDENSGQCVVRINSERDAPMSGELHRVRLTSNAGDPKLIRHFHEGGHTGAYVAYDYLNFNVSARDIREVRNVISGLKKESNLRRFLEFNEFGFDVWKKDSSAKEKHRILTDRASEIEGVVGQYIRQVLPWSLNLNFPIEERTTETE